MYAGHVCASVAVGVTVHVGVYATVRMVQVHAMMHTCVAASTMIWYTLLACFSAVVLCQEARMHVLTWHYPNCEGY